MFVRSPLLLNVSLPRSLYLTEGVKQSRAPEAPSASAANTAELNEQLARTQATGHAAIASAVVSSLEATNGLSPVAPEEARAIVAPAPFSKSLSAVQDRQPPELLAARALLASSDHKRSTVSPILPEPGAQLSVDSSSAWSNRALSLSSSHSAFGALSRFMFRLNHASKLAF